MNFSQFRNWIFDLDGTLTRAIHDFMAIRRALELPSDHGIIEAIEMLDEPERSTKRRQLDQIEKEITMNTSQAPGVHEFLSHLNQKGYKMGILTRNNKENALLTLRNIGLSDFFLTENIICRDQATPKPSPDGIIMLLNAWQANPGESIIVGDFRDDFIAGKEAGIKTVYVDYEGKNLWGDFADFRITQFIEMLPG